MSCCLEEPARTNARSAAHGHILSVPEEIERRSCKSSGTGSTCFNNDSRWQYSESVTDKHICIPAGASDSMEDHQ